VEGMNDHKRSLQFLQQVHLMQSIINNDGLSLSLGDLGLSNALFCKALGKNL
jgi:hypothetical protein